MELKYYRLIKTIAEEGSIANSSGRLFLTQSALSHQLRELETRLGFKVFHRKRNQWELTPEGTELYHLANQLFEAIDKGFSNIQHLKAGSKGQIKLSVECQSFFHEIPGFVQKMGLIYPEIEIDLTLGVTHEIRSKLQSGEIDIAILSSKPDAEDLHVLEVGEDEIFTVLHKEHFLADQTHIEPSQFAKVHLIINSFPLEGVAVYEHSLRAHRVTPGKISAIPFTEISLAMVAANLGVLCAPKWQLNSLKLDENLRFMRIGVNGVKRTHYLMVKKTALQKKYIDSFISTFEEEFRISE